MNKSKKNVFGFNNKKNASGYVRNSSMNKKEEIIHLFQDEIKPFGESKTG